MTANPVMKLPTVYDIVLIPAKEERLSQIIREINSRTGRQYANTKNNSKYENTAPMMVVEKPAYSGDVEE